MSRLFKEVLSNEFSDSRESIRWLVDNNYIVYKCLGSGACYLYTIEKDFKWLEDPCYNYCLIRSNYLAR